MIRIGQLASLGLLIAFLPACKASFRAPICTLNEFEFPEGAAGTYRFQIPAVDPAYSDYLVGLDDTVFTIREDQETYEITTTRNFLNLLKQKKSQNEDDVPSVEAAMPLAVCKIDDTYYSQNLETDGTYSFARVDLSANSIALVDLGFSAERLQRLGFVTYFLPELAFTSYNQQGEWSAGLLSPGKMIVDNSNLSEERRRQLLGNSLPTAMGIVLSRVPEAEAKTWLMKNRHRSRNPLVTLVVSKTASAR